MPSPKADPAWTSLFDAASDIIAHAQEAAGTDFEWSLGGGTVLMFDFNHRYSKDIDIFISDIQYLGFLNPRLQDYASQHCDDYEDMTNYVKLRNQVGDIDFIVATSLTDHPYTERNIRGIPTLVQTHAEIVARKLHHRGSRPTARDLLDLAVVACSEKNLSQLISTPIRENGAALLEQCRSRQDFLEIEYNQLATIDCTLSFQECLTIITDVIKCGS
jgi:hypothetical protein